MKYEPISGREFPRFSAIKTFFRLPHVEVNADYDVALVGVPYDGAASYRGGSRFAASAVRQASSVGRGYNWSRGMHLWSKQKFADIGDCPIVPIDQQQSYDQIQKFFSELVNKNKKFVAVGGDHSVTLPILRALKSKYGVLNFIHFDAHMDTYPAAWGCEVHHGSFARHAIEEGLVDPKKMIQIGLRGPLVDEGDLHFVKKHGVRATTMDDIRIKGLEHFLQNLPEFSGPTYLSFDIDCLDPAYAPGTGTPVPGGMNTYEAQRILRALKVKSLVGADVVEVCPPFDQSEITALAAVDVMFECMCMMTSK